MVLYAYERHMAFEEELGTDSDFRETGWIYVATAACADHLRDQVGLLISLDVASGPLAPDDVHWLFPQLHLDDLSSASGARTDGHFDPHMIMSGYVKQARERGAAIRGGVHVHDLLHAGSGVTGVVITEGAIGAGARA